MNDDRIDQTKLDELAASVAELPRRIEPPEDLWSGIQAEIRNASPMSRLIAVAWWQRPIALAAAAVILIVLSSLGTLAIVGSTARPAGSRTAVEEERGSEAGAPASLAQFTRIETDYIRTVNDLSAALEAQQSELAPGTVAKLRESLRVIDAAIVEARAALAADPANRHLMEILSASYEQKVDLIRRTTEMARG